MHFWSDNSATVAPQIMAALEEANQGVVKSYGADAISARLGELFSQVFEKEVAVLPVPTGTAANALALALLAPPFGAIFCHRESDIHLHACGAPEFYTGGAKLMPIDGPHGKLEPNPVAAAIAELPAGFVHNVQSAAISVAQATECGTVYERQELAALAALARTHELGFHIDGARFANAVTALGCHPAEITWQAGRRHGRGGGRLLRPGARRAAGLSIQARRASRLEDALSRRATRGVSKGRLVAGERAPC
jgi:threonine aldolase